MRTLVIFFLLVGAAQAEDKVCQTRKPAIEARFDQLCPLVRTVHPQPTPWSEAKCATWLFEYGMAGFREATQVAIQNQNIRQSAAVRRAERQAEFGEPTPDPSLPTPSPTVSPTAAPTPVP